MADNEPNEDLEIENLDENPQVSSEGYEELDQKSWHEPYDNMPGWAKTTSKVILGLIILVALVFIGRTIHHHLKNNDTTANNPSTSQQTTGSSSSQSGASSQNSGGQNSTSSSPNTGSTSSTGKGPSSSTVTVPDTGPGDVAALFAGSSALGAGLHYAIRSRRTRR